MNVNMNVNMIQGDYIFYAWVKNEAERYDERVAELEALGYKLVNSEYGFQDEYKYYENPNGDVKVVTIAMC